MIIYEWCSLKTHCKSAQHNPHSKLTIVFLFVFIDICVNENSRRFLLPGSCNRGVTVQFAMNFCGIVEKVFQHDTEKKNALPHNLLCATELNATVKIYVIISKR